MQKFRWLIVVSALLSSACGTPASPSIARPGPDPSVTVALECPADISQLSLDGRPAAATFPLPAVGGSDDRKERVLARVGLGLPGREHDDRHLPDDRDQ